MMIVVGNPDILQTDPYWRELIDYCRKSGSFNGDEPSGTVPQDLDPNEALSLDLSALTINAGEYRSNLVPKCAAFDVVQGLALGEIRF